MSLEKKAPFQQLAQSERDALQKAQEEFLVSQQLQREWQECGVGTVEFASAALGVKGEVQEVKVLEEAGGGDPGCPQHCGNCAVVYLPKVSLPRCQKCRKSVRLLEPSGESNAWRVPRPLHALKHEDVDDLVFRAQLPEVLTLRCLEKTLKEQCVGYTVSTEAKLLLLRAAEEFLSGFYLRANMLAEHRGRKRVSKQDVDLARTLSDRVEMTERLRVAQQEARAEEQQEQGRRPKRKSLPEQAGLGQHLQAGSRVKLDHLLQTGLRAHRAAPPTV